MPGSPATPTHPMPRRIGYFAIGVLVALTAGLSNGLLIGNLQQIQGALGLTSVQAAWLTAAYSMTNVCTSFMLIKFRQQFGLQRLTRVFLVSFVAISGLQVHRAQLRVRARRCAPRRGSSPPGSPRSGSSTSCRRCRRRRGSAG